MAAVDLTNCAICLETLNTPKYLPCLHTFCEDCISTYIASTFEKGNSSKIQCPVCRTELSTPAENCTPAEWAKKLPMNFLIVGLLEKGKIERSEKQCMSCERLEKTSPALFVCVECSEALCENCHHYHKANKFTSRHKTVSINNISEVEKSLNFFRNDCSVHKNEELKLFCIDHDVPCCSLCVSVAHRKCNDVITIEQAAKDAMSSGSGKNIVKELEDIVKDASIIIDHNKKCEEQLDSQYDSAVKKLDAYCHELVSKIENFQQNQREKITKKLNEKKGEIETNVVSLQNLKKTVENEIEILTVCTKKATAVQVMIETKKILDKQTGHQDTILKSFKRSQNYNLSFECKQDVSDLIKVLEKDNVVQCDEAPCDLDLVTVPVLRLKSKNNANIGYNVRDCFFSRDNNIVILLEDYDCYGRNSIWVCDTNTNQLNEWKSYCGQSYGYGGQMTLIVEGNTGEVIVYISQNGMIEFSNFQGGYITHFSLGVTNASCICYYKEKETIIIGLDDSIKSFDRSGSQLATIDADHPRLITMDSQSRLYYVSNDKIISRTIEGQVLKTISIPELTGISGMTLDKNDRLYVTSAQANKVITLSGSERSFEILTENDGLINPTFLHISHDLKTFLVINNNYSEMCLYDIL